MNKRTKKQIVRLQEQIDRSVALVKRHQETIKELDLAADELRGAICSLEAENDPPPAVLARVSEALKVILYGDWKQR